MVQSPIPAPPRKIQKDEKPEGVRYNSGKPGISLMLEARHAVEGCARVMDFGAAKYARSNWRRGLPLTKISDSLARHLVAFLAGEDNDPETGLPHVDHIMCNAFFLSENYHTREDMDDRPFKDGQFVESLTVPTKK